MEQVYIYSYFLAIRTTLSLLSVTYVFIRILTKDLARRNSWKDANEVDKSAKEFWVSID